MNGLDKTFWQRWDNNSELMFRCELLQWDNRLSYDHAVSWMENAREKGRAEERARLAQLAESLRKELQEPLNEGYDLNAARANFRDALLKALGDVDIE